MELGRQQKLPALLWVTANNSWALRKLHAQVRTKRRTKHLKMVSCGFSVPGLSSWYLQEEGTWLGEGWSTPRASEGSQGHKPTPVWALVLCKRKPLISHLKTHTFYTDTLENPARMPNCHSQLLLVTLSCSPAIPGTTPEWLCFIWIAAVWNSSSQLFSWDLSHRLELDQL